MHSKNLKFYIMEKCNYFIRERIKLLNKFLTIPYHNKIKIQYQLIEMTTRYSLKKTFVEIYL